MKGFIFDYLSESMRVLGSESEKGETALEKRGMRIIEPALSILNMEEGMQTKRCL